MTPNILISVVYTEDWQPIVDITRPIVEEYCSTHSYHWIYSIYKRGLKDFDKIRILLEIFKEGYYEYVWSLDADALITNYNIKIEQFIDNKHELFICQDINGINCGSFIIKRTPYMEWLLAWMLDLENVNGKYCEQDALSEFIERFPAQAMRKICYLNHPSINSYHCHLYKEYDDIIEPNEMWEEHDFVLHLPGISNGERIEILKNTKIIK